MKATLYVIKHRSGRYLCGRGGDSYLGESLHRARLHRKKGYAKRHITWYLTYLWPKGSVKRDDLEIVEVEVKEVSDGGQ